MVYTAVSKNEWTNQTERKGDQTRTALGRFKHDTEQSKRTVSYIAAYLFHATSFYVPS